MTSLHFWFNSWVRKILWRRDRLPSPVFLGFPCGSAGKESPCNVGDLGLIPGLGRSPGEEKGYPLQYSALKNSLDCIDHGVTKSQTWLNDFHFTSPQGDSDGQRSLACCSSWGHRIRHDLMTKQDKHINIKNNYNTIKIKEARTLNLGDWSFNPIPSVSFSHTYTIYLYSQMTTICEFLKSFL